MVRFCAVSNCTYCDYIHWHISNIRTRWYRKPTFLQFFKHLKFFCQKILIDISWSGIKRLFNYSFGHCLYILRSCYIIAIWSFQFIMRCICAMNINSQNSVCFVVSCNVAWIFIAMMRILVFAVWLITLKWVYCGIFWGWADRCKKQSIIIDNKKNIDNC